MKIKGSIKNSVKYYCAALVLTAVFITFLAAIIVTEKNTAAIGFEKISTPLSLEVSGGSAVLTVNDREHCISLWPIIYALESRILRTVAALFLVL